MGAGAEGLGGRAAWTIMAAASLLLPNQGAAVGPNTPVTADVKARSKWRGLEGDKGSPDMILSKIWQRHSLRARVWAGSGRVSGNIV